MKRNLFAIVFAILLFGLGSTASAINTDGNTSVVTSQSGDSQSGSLVGNDKDEHGCIGSAGYTWSGSLQACIRPWSLSGSYEIIIVASGTKIMPKVSVTIPEITLPKIKSDLDYYVAVTKKIFLKQANTIVADPENTIEPELTISCTIANENDSSIAIDCLSYEYNGGAHGNTSTFTLNYYKDGEKLITLGNLFAKQKNYLTALSKRSIANFSTKFDDKKRLNEGLSANIDNFNDFTVTSQSGKVENITFYFDQYQIAPYSEGRQSITFDYPTLSIIPQPMILELKFRK